MPVNPPFVPVEPVQGTDTANTVTTPVRDLALALAVAAQFSLSFLRGGAKQAQTGAYTQATDQGDTIVCGRTGPAYCRQFDNSLALLPASIPRVEPNGLLCEGATQQNIGPYSQWIVSSGAGTTWTFTSLTGTGNAGNAPDNTNTSNLLQCVAGSAKHFVSQAALAINAVTNTASIYLKAGTVNFVCLAWGTGTVVFNLSTQAFLNPKNLVGSPAFEALPGGWYRVQLQITGAGTSPLFLVIPGDTQAHCDANGTNTAPTWTAAGTETIQAWGLQAESLPFASSYFPYQTNLWANAASSSWGVTSGTAGHFPVVTGNTLDVPDPFGLFTATRVDYPVTLTGDLSVYESPVTAFSAGQAYNKSVWLRVASGTGTVYFHRNDGSNAFDIVTCNLTTTWQRFTGTFTPGNVSQQIAIGYQPYTGGNVTPQNFAPQTVYVYVPQLDWGTAPTATFASAAITFSRGADLIYVKQLALAQYGAGAMQVSAKVIPLGTFQILDPVTGRFLWYIGDAPGPPFYSWEFLEFFGDGTNTTSEGGAGGDTGPGQTTSGPNTTGSSATVFTLQYAGVPASTLVVFVNGVPGSTSSPVVGRTTSAKTVWLGDFGGIGGYPLWGWLTDVTVGSGLTPAVGSEYDLSIVAGDIALTSGTPSILQNVRMALLLFMGEMYNDIQSGIPYFQTLFVKGADANALRSIFYDAISAVPGVVGVNYLNLTFDNNARQLSVAWSATTSNGQLISDLTPIPVTSAS